MATIDLVIRDELQKYRPEPVPLSTLSFYRDVYTPNVSLQPYWSWETFKYVRDENGNILVNDSISLGQIILDDIHFSEQCARFIGISNTMNAIKEELMMKVWHPMRVLKFLETWGEDAFDNFAGV